MYMLSVILQKQIGMSHLQARYIHTYMFGGLTCVDVSSHSLPGKFWAGTNLNLRSGLVPNILLISCHMVNFL